MHKQIAQPLPQTLMKPQIPGEKKPVARLPYKGISHILNHVPINVTLRGQFPSFDDDKEDIDLPDMTLKDDLKQRNSFPLIGQILDTNIFRHLLCNPNFACSRIISVSIWGIYISSTHSHLYQRW